MSIRLRRSCLTVAALALAALAAAQTVVTALDVQGQSLYQSAGQLMPGTGVHLLYGGAGYLHKITALLLRQAFLVDQADGFVLIYRQDHRFLLWIGWVG